jgi:NADH:ubiquinone oxidoreductase subunit D
MVLLELNRVLNHVQFLSEISYEFCMESLYRYSLIWLKRIQSLILSYTGNEFGINTIRFGGVTKDVSQDWLSRTINEVVWLEGSILSAYKNIIKNAYTKSSFDFQLISKKVAGAWSVTGPLVRAVGINLDYRKLSPFYYYNDVEFDIPIGVKGTGYDLLVVRVEEIFQSIKIIVQVLDNLPTGQIMNESINEHLYFKDGSMELDEDKYRESVKNYLDIKNVSGTQLLEGSNGLMSLTVNQSVNTVNRLKVGTSSFYLKTLFERVIKGSEVNIVKPFWSVLDINLKEAER